MLAEVVGPVKDEARAGVEARLLARADGQDGAPAAGGGAAGGAARRRRRRRAGGWPGAIRERSVRLQPGEDGMGALTAVMTLPVAAACRRALEAYAEDCRDARR